jgi:hypothetical protein
MKHVCPGHPQHDGASGGDALRYRSTRIQPPNLTQLIDEVINIV